MPSTTKKAAKSAKPGRKPMTDAEKAEEKRISGYDYSAVAVEESEDLSAVRAQANNEMIPHLRRSLDEGEGEGQERIGKTLAMVLPDEPIAKRAKSKLVSAAEHLKCGVRTSGPSEVKDDEGKTTGWKISFRAVAKRKEYKPRKTAESAK